MVDIHSEYVGTAAKPDTDCVWFFSFQVLKLATPTMWYRRSIQHTNPPPLSTSPLLDDRLTLVQKWGVVLSGSVLKEIPVVFLIKGQGNLKTERHSVSNEDRTFLPVISNKCLFSRWPNMMSHCRFSIRWVFPSEMLMTNKRWSGSLWIRTLDERSARNIAAS